jgi:hypothetical protein
MKTLKETIKIRGSVFDESKRDDTLDLSNLKNNSIDAERFFSETFFTDGMKLLLDTAFKRFRGKASNGLIKLTQAMGGGKTHNMLALGLLAKNPEFRKTILNGRYKDIKEEIKVITFTGRESDLPFGIWGEIAKQLGKEKQFDPYYSPLKAPGQSAWIELLKDEKPTLILLDELPPYLNYSKTQPHGNGTLLDITTTALSNLFNALNKEELHNVCLIVSDLEATYLQGSQVIRTLFDDLQNEIHRSSINIEPVSANTDDLYNILRTRLFDNVVDKDTIDEIASQYQASVKEAKEMRYTDENPADIASGIRSSYPFHPSIRDLFARFKENAGFQQTRGFIRLTRSMVKGLFSENGLASKRYLINPYDIDLNDSEMITIIKGIKPELSNAISHDIASAGSSTAELLDKPTNSTDMQDLTKLILVSSLSSVTGSVVGLTLNEAIAYISTPGRNITNIQKNLEDLKMRAWYLFFDRDNRLYFRKVQNVNAQLNDEIRGFSYEQAKLHIKKLLSEKFKPTVKDCYQEVFVFPSIEEIDLKKNKVSLILTEPNNKQNDLGLQEDILKFYEESTYKNRCLFLSGQRVAMDNLIDITKSFKAIENIIHRMENEEKIAAGDSELIQAKDIQDKISAKLYSNIREAFVTLYFPKKNGLESQDFKMEFSSNNFNTENQIKNVLLEVMKFTTEIEPNKLKRKFETRIFSQKRMTWNHLLERVATEVNWQWHKPEALNDLRNDCIKKGYWIEEGGYLDKEPPAPETSVNVIETHRNNETGEVTLKVIPTNGDIVHYEIDDDATTASSKIKDLSNFKTKELKISFLCIDSKGKNRIGKQHKWENKVVVKYKTFDKNGKRFMQLLATSADVEIRYSTDGSNPINNGGIYLEPFEIPQDATFIQAVAVNEAKQIYSAPLQQKVELKKFSIIKDKPVYFNDPIITANTKETFDTFESFKKYQVSVKGLDITIQEKNSDSFITLALGEFEISNFENVILELNNLLDNFFVDKTYEVNTTISDIKFPSGNIFEQWISEQKKTTDEFEHKITQNGL